MTQSTCNILLYSHDTYGLGHIRRTMAIASNLLQENVNILILTGSPIVGRFDFPEGIDFVRIPGMIKKTNDLYLPHSIRVDAEHALNIRQNIITATAKAFKPMMFLVDKAPLGLKREILPTLKWFRKCSPETKVVLGLRDIMDDAESTRKDWKRKRIYEILDRMYSEIWVYGEQDFYDPIKEYGIPDSVCEKMVFTGYIPRIVPKKKHLTQVRRETRLKKKDKLVVVTTGGGGDGYPLLDAYLRMLEKYPEAPFRTIMISGPFMPAEHRQDLAKRARKVGVSFHSFFKRIEKPMAAADLVVSMGGYNTVCETLSFKKVSLVVPRETPRLEQTIRAEIFYKRGLLEYLPWAELSPDSLYAKIPPLLENPEPYLENINQFGMPGLDSMRRRLAVCRGTEE